MTLILILNYFHSQDKPKETSTIAMTEASLKYFKRFSWKSFFQIIILLSCTFDFQVVPVWFWLRWAIKRRSLILWPRRAMKILKLKFSSVIALAKFQSMVGAFHHPTLVGSYQTCIQMSLPLSVLWIWHITCLFYRVRHEGYCCDFSGFWDI